MTKTLILKYDGNVFRPEEPVDLSPETRVRAVIEPVERTPGRPGGFLRTTSSLSIDGPPDWSRRLEEYLYGSAEDAA